MKRPLLVLLTVTLAGSMGALAIACSEEEATAVPGGGDASTRKDGGGGSSGDPIEENDGGGEEEEETDGGDSCVGQYEAPNVNAAGPCGTMEFGQPAASFTGVDEDAGTTYEGALLADGIYDAVKAERQSANPGSWRETFVVKGNRFTRIRQLDLNGSGPGTISYRSGTFAYDTAADPQLIKLTYDCAQSGDNKVDAGEDNLPSDAIVAADCSAQYRYGASGIRVTLRRR